MVEYLPFWKLFFRKLGYAVNVLTPTASLLEKGTEITGGGFCAPISYWHGHVHELSQRSDYVFLPHMLEGGEPGDPKFYCYYSNYAVTLLETNACPGLGRPVDHAADRFFQTRPP